MRHYKVTDDKCEALPDAPLHNSDCPVDELPVVPQSVAFIDQRIANIDRQIRRLRQVEKSVLHWESVISAQTIERDKWNAEIEKSKAMLVTRQNELEERSELIESMLINRQKLARERLAILIRELGTNATPELREVLRALLNS